MTKKLTKSEHKKAHEKHQRLADHHAKKAKEHKTHLTKAVREARKKPGGSNAGKYEGVKSFAGPSGGAPKGTYPINTKKRAKAALAYAHNAPNPAGIRRAVHRKYPDLGAPKRGK